MRAFALIAFLAATPIHADQVQDCIVAEALYGAMLDDHVAVGGQVDASDFAALSDGEKWYWVASKLTAQAFRMHAVMQNPNAQPRDWLLREAQIYLTLEATEPCFRHASEPYLKFAKIPADDWRAALRAQMEDLL